MSPNRMSALLDLVFGGSALALIFLYAVGIFKIPFTLLFAMVGALSAIGLGLPRIFPRNSRAPLPRPLYFSIATLILATVSFVYSYFNGESWIPIIVGGILTFVGVAAMLVAVFRTPPFAGDVGAVGDTKKRILFILNRSAFATSLSEIDSHNSF